MRIEGKRIVILTAHEFEDIEVLYPILRLSPTFRRYSIMYKNFFFRERMED